MSTKRTCWLLGVDRDDGATHLPQCVRESRSRRYWRSQIKVVLEKGGKKKEPRSMKGSDADLRIHSALEIALDGKGLGRG